MGEIDCILGFEILGNRKGQNLSSLGSPISEVD